MYTHFCMYTSVSQDTWAGDTTFGFAGDGCFHKVQVLFRRFISGVYMHLYIEEVANRPKVAQLTSFL